MFNRLRRKTMAPSRPLLYPEQVGLALFSVLIVGASIWLVIKVVF